MGAKRKLDAAAVERIVAGRGEGRSFGEIAERLGVDASTVSRRVGSDPELQAQIAVAQKLAVRRARDRDRKGRATGGRARARSGAVASPARSRAGSPNPHGRRDELRAARRVILNLPAAYDDREQARETLLELLEATRRDGQPAYSLRFPAAKALLNDPVCLAEFLPKDRPSQAHRRRQHPASTPLADIPSLTKIDSIAKAGR